MCGIAGIININNREHLAGEITGMTNLLKHRGPDDEGFVFFDSGDIVTAGGKDTPPDVWQLRYGYAPVKQAAEVTGHYTAALGFRRLSVLDISAAGHQPMCTPDRKLWVVFNGEIYNHPEIRENLRSKGYTFRTSSDTEVLLAAYMEWGEQCLERFNGMWAFAIYDTEKKILFGARDRFGVKPLYYYFDHQTFAFASEQKALAGSAFCHTGINNQMVFDYFASNNIESREEGFFRNIIEVMPSCAFRFSIETRLLQKWEYYKLPYNDQPEQFDDAKFAMHKEKTRELIFNAINLRLRSDVPAGSCLSGGLDSSAIVCTVNELMKANSILSVGSRQKTFTAAFHDKRYDESMWAEMVAQKTGAEWFRVTPEPGQLLEELETLIYCQDTPIWNTSTFAQFKVMELAKQNGVKVLLDGQGGDELFAGYRHYHYAYVAELTGKYDKSVFREINHTGHPVQDLAFLLKCHLKKKFPIMNLLPPEAGYLNRELISLYGNVPYTRNKITAPLNRILYDEFNRSYLKGYLKCEDRCSMWFSIEARTPFSDDLPLIEYIFSLPACYKIHHGVNKFLLRESMRGLLPEAVASRKDKLGYATPHNQWIAEIKNDLRNYFSSDLNDFLDTGKILSDYDLLFNRREKKEKHNLFKLISFAVWKKVFRV